MSQNNVVIQINSVEALNRLIGDNPELLIQIRNSVANNFLRKSVRGNIEEDIQKKAMDSLKEDLTKEFFDVTNSNYSYYKNYHLKNDLKKMIVDAVREEVRKEVWATVREEIKSSETNEKITIELNRASSYIMETLTDKNIEERLNAMVNKKIKEKFNI